MISHLSAVTRLDFYKISTYVSEFENNAAFQHQIERALHQEGDRTEYDLGKLIASYVIIRATKPEVLVEITTRSSQTSAIIIASLSKNFREGCRSYYYGLASDSLVRYSFTQYQSQGGKIFFGDSAECLKLINNKKVEVVIDNSNPDEEDSVTELMDSIKNMLAENAILINDHHFTRKGLDIN